MALIREGLLGPMRIVALTVICACMPGTAQERTASQERPSLAAITSVARQGDTLRVTFDQPVRVHGRPSLQLLDGRQAPFAEVEGGTVLLFKGPANIPAVVTTVKLNGGAIVSAEGNPPGHPADLTLPSMPQPWIAQFVYQPSRVRSRTPTSAALKYEEVALETSDGLRLSAWYVPAERERGTVLFCHGNAGNIAGRLESLKFFHGLGLSVLIFDYRGYGYSEGAPSEQGTYLDAEAAWDYLVKRRGAEEKRIVIFGRSLGGAVAARLAKEHVPAGLVLESTFTSMQDLIQDMVPALLGRLLCPYQYDTKTIVAELRCPKLIIHSPDDEVVTFSHGKDLFRAAAEPKRFVRIRGAHNDGFLRSKVVYTKAWRDFLADCLVAPAGADSRPAGPRPVTSGPSESLAERLALAKSYLAADLPEDAEKVLAEIISRDPRSPQAVEAEGLHRGIPTRK